MPKKKEEKSIELLICDACKEKHPENKIRKHRKECPVILRLKERHPGVFISDPEFHKPAAVGSDGKSDSTHYGGADNPHETIKCLAACGLEKDALCWNTAKYISRAGKKAGATLLRDLEKAHYYLGKRIEGLKKEIVENAEAR